MLPDTVKKVDYSAKGNDCMAMREVFLMSGPDRCCGTRIFALLPFHQRLYRGHAVVRDRPSVLFESSSSPDDRYGDHNWLSKSSNIAANEKLNSVTFQRLL